MAEASEPTSTDALRQPLGQRIRERRKSMGMTLDELAVRTSVSKPYLSLIETGRVNNPPSDEKLRRIEHALGFAPAELVSQAHFARTPPDVRAMLLSLARRASAQESESGVDLDEALNNGALRSLVETTAANVQPTRINAVPVINKVSAGYPREFTDLDFPARHADAHVSCPEIDDPDAFAARVCGDSMNPLYREGDIVVFSPRAQPLHGDDCFVRLADGESTFKRVFYEEAEPDDEGHRRGVVRLQPRNEKYPPRVLDAEDVSAIYRAVYRYEAVNAG
ncbi:MAG: S24 family peptidase [Planctomycetota bacterium]